MNISEEKRTDGRIGIEIHKEAIVYSLVVDEVRDGNGNLHIPSSIIDATGFPNPTMDKLSIIDELSRKGYIVDKQ